MSLSELKSIKPRRYCSECDKTKPTSQFPVIERGLRNKPGKICSECTEKHKQPKKEPEIIGISESKPLLQDLNIVKGAVEVDEDEPRTKECAECREFKDLEEFDSSNKICEECWEDLQRQSKLKPEEPEIKETKTCTKCDKTKSLEDFYPIKGTDRFETACKLCKLEMAKERRNKKRDYVNNELTKNPADKNIQAKESTEKRALELLNEYPTFFKRYKITVKMLVEKFGFAKSTAANYMKVLADNGFFKEQGRGNGRSWSYIDGQKITSKPVMESKADKGPKDVPARTHVNINEPCNISEESYSLGDSKWVNKCPKCGCSLVYDIESDYIHCHGCEQYYNKEVGYSPIGMFRLEFKDIKDKIEQDNINKQNQEGLIKEYPEIFGDKIIEEKPVKINESIIDRVMEETREKVNNTINNHFDSVVIDDPIKVDPEFRALLTKMWDIRQAKRVDYNAGAMNNFELTSQLLGIDPHVGILVRMSDKLSRLGSFTQKGFNAVTDESVEDTLLDLANYSLLCIIEYRKTKGLVENGL
jgi:protein-arginine kinase activator protein McsA